LGIVICIEFPANAGGSDFMGIVELLEMAFDGIIECPKCGNSIEPDCEKCNCGWKNTLIECGLI